MTNPTILASAKIGRDSITVELIEPPDASTAVLITWPKKSVSISPRRFPETAASLTRLFANASTELSRLKAASRRPKLDL
jgi:hypothetical protein